MLAPRILVSGFLVLGPGLDNFKFLGLSLSTTSLFDYSYLAALCKSLLSAVSALMLEFSSSEKCSSMETTRSPCPFLRATSSLSFGVLQARKNCRKILIDRQLSYFVPSSGAAIPMFVVLTPDKSPVRS